MSSPVLQSEEEGEAKERLIPNQQKNTCRHANTTWEEGGAIGSLGLCQQSQNHKVSSNEHTLWWEVLLKFSCRSRRKCPKRSSRCICGFLLFLFSSFLFYIKLFTSEFLGSFNSVSFRSAAAHTLMGRVWLICCRTTSWLVSGLFLLCPGSVPPSRSRSLPTQSNTVQRQVHGHLNKT